MLEMLQKDWLVQAREDQLPPVNIDWTTWLLLGGRGAGKTRTGAEWVRGLVEGVVAGNIALIGETFGDVREVMIDGPSGLCGIATADMRPRFEPSRHRLVWPNGAMAQIFSSEAPEGIRGYQFDAAWADEVCKWRYDETTWSNLQLALRLGKRPRQVVTTTPKPSSFLKRLIARPTTYTTKSRTLDNAENLAAGFLGEVSALYAGTRLGRQELDGEIIEHNEAALWSWAMMSCSIVFLKPILAGGRTHRTIRSPVSMVSPWSIPTISAFIRGMPGRSRTFPHALMSGRMPGVGTRVTG